MLDDFSDSPAYRPDTGVSGSAYGPGSDGRMTAAILVWVSAAVCVGLFGLCTLALVVVVVWQPPEVMNQVMSQIPPDEQEQMLLGLHIIPVCVLVLFVLPGIALGVLGFGVKAGRAGQVIACIVILWSLIGLLGVMLLFNVVGGLFSGDLVGLAINVVLLGAVVALLLVTVLKVHTVRPGQTRDWSDEPWNNHLMG